MSEQARGRASRVAAQPEDTKETSIPRIEGASREAFFREYVLPLRPVIVTDAIAHWPALERWTPEFFRSRHGGLRVEIDGNRLTLGELIDRVLDSNEASPAPYLRNQLLSAWPAELRADILPLPACTQPNWLESRLFPSREPQTFLEIYIGGRGARFPLLHFDGFHTHAFLMQVYGEKEYVAYPPSQSAYMYARSGNESGKSNVNDVDDPDLTAFPLFARARGIRFELHRGETLFVPAGWWHTARILSPSITVSVNSANRANWSDFARDYSANVARRSRLRARFVSAYLAALGQLLTLVG